VPRLRAIDILAARRAARNTAVDSNETDCEAERPLLAGSGRQVTSRPRRNLDLL
jgi:hypothetical protein